MRWLLRQWPRVHLDDWLEHWIDINYARQVILTSIGVIYMCMQADRRDTVWRLHSEPFCRIPTHTLFVLFAFQLGLCSYSSFCRDSAAVKPSDMVPSCLITCHTRRIHNANVNREDGFCITPFCHGMRGCFIHAPQAEAVSLRSQCYTALLRWASHRGTCLWAAQNYVVLKPCSDHWQADAP